MSADALSLAYGAEMGDGRFRESLADWLSRQYTEPVKPESLMVTNGSSNALDMICARFTRPGDVVLVEDPTYFIARRQFADHGLAIIAAPMDNDGVDIHTLERLVKVHTPAFFYTVPTFHNPTGRTLTAERRAMLTTMAKRLNCVIVADEVYHLLHYGSRPPAPLACLDTEAPVLSIGTFSKILAPGLRLGWIQTNEAMLNRIKQSALLAGGGGLAPFTSALVRPVIDSGRLDEHLGYLKTLYGRRLEVLADGLVRYLVGSLILRVRMAAISSGRH
jgi:DNA-binding transcriptional MocR family regulator